MLIISCQQKYKSSKYKDELMSKKINLQVSSKRKQDS